LKAIEKSQKKLKKKILLKATFWRSQMFSTEKNCVEVIYSFEEKNLTYLRRPNPQFPQKF
jgi:hypothetical protein